MLARLLLYRKDRVAGRAMHYRGSSGAALARSARPFATAPAPIELKTRERTKITASPKTIEMLDAALNLPPKRRKANG